MRKLIVSAIVSLDGYFEGPGGNVMALPMDTFFDTNNLERLREADTILYGGNTYRGMMGYWPHVADNPAVSPAVQADPRLAALHQETGARINETPKIVVSDSLTTQDTGAWSDTTTIVRRAAAHQAIADLKTQPGKDIITFGSRVLWNDLLAAGLVDELYLMVGNTVLGGGTPAFAQPCSLRLLDTRRTDGSDNVLLHYAIVHN